MENNLKIPFAIGQSVFSVGDGYREEYITCPECLGYKTITMTQHNGETFEIECAGCRQGYDPSTGTVKRVFYKHFPTPFICNRVSVNGDSISYSQSSPDSSCYSSKETKYLFTTKEDCQKECDKLNIELTKQEDERLFNNLKSKKRDLAWSVHYWNNQRLKLERDLKFVNNRLGLCEEKLINKKFKEN